MLMPVIVCRHRNIEWYDANNCRCRECGRFGQWLEGFMLWVRSSQAKRLARRARQYTSRAEGSGGPLSPANSRRPCSSRLDQTADPDEASTNC